MNFARLRFLLLAIAVSLSFMAMAMAIGGCSSTPDFSRYQLRLSMHLSGDTAVCGSAMLVDTSSNIKIGFDDQCFTFRRPSAEDPTPGDGP